MGWCHEFGPQIREGCGHPMRAGESACVCLQCGVLCSGRFAGCAEGWARGPREVHVVSPPTTLARRTAVPAQAQRRAPEGAGAEQARNEVLAWPQAAFDGRRDELRVLAGGLARQQVALSDLAATRDDDVAEALAEVKGWASELRSETLRLQGFEKAVAERLRDEMTTTIHAGVDRIAVAAKGDEVRDALASVEERAAELREETTRLHEFGAALADQVRTEVARTVQQEIGSLGESAQAAPPIADALAQTIRAAIGEALQQVQQSAPTGAPAPDGPPTLPVEEVPVPANEPVAEAESVA